MTCAWMAAGLLLSCLVSADPTGPLEGSWEIISVIDNGEVQPSRVVFEKFAEDGRLSVKGNVIRCKNPGHKDLQEMACVVDTTKNPNTIDLAGAERVNTKGIFSVQGDMLTLCFGSPDVVTRPDRFSAHDADSCATIGYCSTSTSAPATATSGCLGSGSTCARTGHVESGQNRRYLGASG